MKLSTRGQYGVVAMLDLAMHTSEGCVSLKSIAERQGISENYLEQLFSALKRAKLVNSIRGAQGGYTLSRDPEKVSLGDVLRAVEGSLAPVDCVRGKSPTKCERIDCCVSRTVWEKVRDGIHEVVDSISLGSLVKEFLEYKKKQDYMYYI